MYLIGVNCSYWSIWGELLLILVCALWIPGLLIYLRIRQWNFKKRILKAFPDAHLFYRDQGTINDIRRHIKKGNHNKALAMLDELELSEVSPFAYQLACIYAMLGDFHQCRKYLEISSNANILPSKRTAKKEKSFQAVSDKAWFDGLNWMQKYPLSEGKKYYHSNGKKYYFSNGKLFEKPTSGIEQTQ